MSATLQAHFALQDMDLVVIMMIDYEVEHLCSCWSESVVSSWSSTSAVACIEQKFNI
jgi:hypothetical protein